MKNIYKIYNELTCMKHIYKNIYIMNSDKQKMNDIYENE